MIEDRGQAIIFVEARKSARRKLPRYRQTQNDIVKGTSRLSNLQAVVQISGKAS